MKMVIGLYKNSSGDIHPTRFDYDSDGDTSSSFMVTERIEVDFPDIAHEVVVDRELSLLNRAEQELMAKYQKAKEDIEERRARLLCITHQE